MKYLLVALFLTTISAGCGSAAFTGSKSDSTEVTTDVTDPDPVATPTNGCSDTEEESESSSDIIVFGTDDGSDDAGQNDDDASQNDGDDDAGQNDDDDTDDDADDEGPSKGDEDTSTCTTTSES